MGLFEEIERAWFTLDNKLFLWDYSDGWVAVVTSRLGVIRLAWDSRDFSRFDEQADIIQAVGLVKARKGVLRTQTA
jgi:nuclear pore complex protein Nup155